MSLATYLSGGLIADGHIRAELAEQARPVAEAWARAGVEPVAVELLAETLARISRELGHSRVDALNLIAATAFLEPSPPVVELMQAAAVSPLDARTLAALAVHLVDIVEALAIRLYVPELPALVARSDRSGEAARAVGLARHLRG